MKTKAVIPWLAVLALLAACGDQPMEANNASADMGDNLAFNQGESVYCEAVEQRVSPEDCEDLTRADAEVRPGAAAFNVPDPMRRGQTVEVHLIIDRRSPREIRVIEQLPEDGPSASDANTMSDGPETNVSSDLPDTNTAVGPQDPPQGDTAPGNESTPTPGQIVEGLEGTPERFYPPVGRHMRAELVGQGFEIVAKTETSQQIPLGGQASWVWQVTARQGGNQSLTLVTIVEGVANGRRFVLARRPTVRTVSVEVSLRDRIWDGLTAAPNWIKAVTAVIVAVGGLFTAWYGLPWRRRRKAAGERPPREEPGESAASGGDGEAESGP